MIRASCSALQLPAMRWRFWHPQRRHDVPAPSPGKAAPGKAAPLHNSKPSPAAAAAPAAAQAAFRQYYTTCCLPWDLLTAALLLLVGLVQLRLVVDTILGCGPVAAGDTDHGHVDTSPGHVQLSSAAQPLWFQGGLLAQWAAAGTPHSSPQGA